ncbi:hypothetical protein UNDKW_3684 [Undibacterium sp. KW1]|nr:hypothetical protein UNDKW_3684 [Undibacterium sp. KW1]
MAIAEFIIYSIVGIVLLAIIVTISIPFFLLKGLARVIGIICVVGIWTYLYHTKLNTHDPELQRRISAQKICETELSTLPDSIVIENFTDEGAALRVNALINLFKERKLSFVEIKVHSDERGRSYIAYPIGDGESHWLVNGEAGSYAKLELSNKGDPDCAHLPSSVANSIDKVPFLPDTCMRITYASQPTSNYRLNLIPATKVNYGAWVLLDQKAGKELTRLTTTDSENHISSGRATSLIGKRDTDCRSPHAVIADRLIGAASFDKKSQVLNSRTVDAEVDMSKEDINNYPLLGASLKVDWSSTDEKLSTWRYSPQLSHELWSEMIIQAMVHDHSNYGKLLLDWKSHELISLRVTQEKNPYPWESFALGDGFIVLSQKSGWSTRQENVLARFSKTGKLIWVLRVPTPAGSSEKCSTSWPQAVYIENNDFILDMRCNRWKIPVTALPQPL